MFKILVCAGLFTLLPLQAKNETLPSRISEMKQWVNKYPHEEISGVSLLTLKVFKNHLMKALGRKKYKEYLLIEDKATVFPVKQSRDFLHVSMCEAHNCGGHEFHFFINTKESKIFICEQEMKFPKAKIETPVKLQVTWYGTINHVRINNQHCDVYDEKTRDIDWEKTISQIPNKIR